MAQSMIGRILTAWQGTRLSLLIGPGSIHEKRRPQGQYGAGMGRTAATVSRTKLENRDCGVLRQAAHHGWLEGPYQRSVLEQTASRCTADCGTARELAGRSMIGLCRQARTTSNDQPQDICGPDFVGCNRRRARRNPRQRERGRVCLPGRFQETAMIGNGEDRVDGAGRAQRTIHVGVTTGFGGIRPLLSTAEQ